MKFKDFISEASVSQSPSYKMIDDHNEAFKFVKDRCSDAIWMLEQNKPIYRGDTTGPLLDGKYATVDTSKTERHSNNTANFYTVILDNHPEMKDFPKRSRSFICSTIKDSSENYARSSDEYLYYIIPTNDAKIGVVGFRDMWDIRILLVGTKRYIEDHNELFSQLEFHPKRFKIEDLIKFDKDLKNNNGESINKLNLMKHTSEYPYIMEYKDSFLEEVWRAYGPESTNLKYYNTSNLPKNINSEVWVSGEILMMNSRQWNDLTTKF